MNCLAYTDFYTLAFISAYFAWRKGEGRTNGSKLSRKTVICALIGVWIFCFALASIPMLELCGKIGYDAVHGKCHIIECEKCFEDSPIYLPPGGFILTIAVVLPFFVVLLSYWLVYKSLSSMESSEETNDQRRSVLILTTCYFIFILPIGIVEWLPESISERAFITVILYHLVLQRI